MQREMWLRDLKVILVPLGGMRPAGKADFDLSQSCDGEKEKTNPQIQQQCHLSTLDRAREDHPLKLAL